MDQLEPDDISISVSSPDEYAWASVDFNTCRGCDRTFVLHPIGNCFSCRFDPPHQPGFVCDECAERIAASAVFDVLLRLRDVIPRSDFGIGMVSRRRLTSMDTWVVKTNMCAHCDEAFEPHWTQRTGEFFLCEKMTRRPLCDDCAALLAPAALVDVLSSLRKMTNDPSDVDPA